MLENKIDQLIEAGWQVILSDFDAMAFSMWRQEALECLTDFMGPTHATTRCFQESVQRPDSRDVLRLGGLITDIRIRFASEPIDGIE